MTCICKDCGHVFEEDSAESWLEELGHPDHPFYEVEKGCPMCYSPFEMAYECESCGQFVGYLQIDDGICRRCQNKMEGDECVEYEKG